MARFRNDTGSVLTLADLGREVGPGEEVDWPDYKPGTHGPVPGFSRTDLKTPAHEARKPRRGGAGTEDSK